MYFLRDDGEVFPDLALIPIVYIFLPSLLLLFRQFPEALMNVISEWYLEKSFLSQRSFIFRGSFTRVGKALYWLSPSRVYFLFFMLYLDSRKVLSRCRVGILNRWYTLKAGWRTTKTLNMKFYIIGIFRSMNLLTGKCREAFKHWKLYNSTQS